jgi:1-acyl-sn-glycerol-3-phosphate acyltransferase
MSIRPPRSARSATFPWVAPTWPGTIERPPAKNTLGVDYDTAWARRYGARLARFAVTEGVTRPMARLLADPQVDGLDRLDQLDEAVIFAANHASHIDTPLLLSVLPERWRHRTVVAGAADYFFDRRWKAAFFALTINAIPIERLRVNRRSANLAASLLDDNWSLLIFPEGGRTPDGWGQTHTRGAAWLAVRTQRPVVPVYVEGTRQVLPRHGSRLRPATTRVNFGSPLRPEPGMDARDLADRIEGALGVLADEQVTDWWTARQRAAAGKTPALTGPAAAPWRRSWALSERARPRDRARDSSEPSWPRL